MYRILHPQELELVNNTRNLVFLYKIICKNICSGKSILYNEGYHIPVTWDIKNSCWSIRWKKKTVYEYSNHRNSNLLHYLNNSKNFNNQLEKMNFKINENRSLLFFDIDNENKVYSFSGLYQKDILGNNNLIEFNKSIEEKIFKDISIVKKNSFLKKDMSYIKLHSILKKDVLEKKLNIKTEQTDVVLNLDKLYIKNKNYNFYSNKKVYKENFVKEKQFYNNKDNIILSTVCFSLSEYLADFFGCNILVFLDGKNCAIQIKKHKKKVIEVIEKEDNIVYMPMSF